MLTHELVLIFQPPHVSAGTSKKLFWESHLKTNDVSDILIYFYHLMWQILFFFFFSCSHHTVKWNYHFLYEYIVLTPLYTHSKSDSIIFMVVVIAEDLYVLKKAPVLWHI